MSFTMLTTVRFPYVVPLSQLDCQTDYMTTVAGQHKSKEYLAINPSATVPSMVDGDLFLTESNSILRKSQTTSTHNHLITS